MTEDEVQSIVEKYPIGPSGCPEWTSPDGSVRLILGDCLEVLPTLSGIDAVVTDPPYGVEKGYASFEDTAKAYSDLIESAIPMMCQATPRRLITCGVKNIWRYPKPDWVLCWWKPNAMTQSGVANANVWEPILCYGCKGFGTDGIQVPIVLQNIDHPCPKPLRLFVWLCEKAVKEFEVICDPFMGSGTTGVACIRTGRRFIGIEIEPKYFEIAVQRCKKAIREDKSSFQIRPKPRPVGFFEKKKK